MEHPQRENMLLAADNADQLFECDECEGGFSIRYVLQWTKYDWRPVKQTKKIKRWLWADKDGNVTHSLYSEQEAIKNTWPSHRFPIKLLWSETEFEVEE